jgi:DNA-binding response OmpR family regulator
MLVLSALDFEETSVRCKELGPIRYFLKPFNPIELINVVRSLVTSEELDRDRKTMVN